MLRHWFEKQWQGMGWAQALLLPLSMLFAVLSGLRRLFYQVGLLSSQALPVPVVVVGNLSVGGVGKTPVVIYLAQQLLAAGYRPGILSRGYGGQHTGEVTPDSLPQSLGDEPVLIAGRTGCPIWVDANRVAGGLALLQAHPEVNVILCDDGLQHYALQRDIEIAVVQRPLGIGNGHLLPAGPLRERLRRLQTVDIIVESGQVPAGPWPVAHYVVGLEVGRWTSVTDLNTHLSNAELQQRALVAIAGIGHPQRFFNTVSNLGITCETVAFADHHAYRKEDFLPFKQKTILMTEKDAVKCQHLGLTNAWYLPVSAQITPLGDHPSLTENVIRRLQQCKGNRHES
ncbi:tetraacyldisaccharide 4'-kinase [Methylophilus sp. VKM B-3414]|uniref:tetraacyldisaccharide 4'-kinase n=1 Tax=Methylophilus sp. VKM B-3414 TaxID=3076121 RepID=UPI0028C65283|nr:tetraacyldisaccharide 4'-kinase [Methylophilus sp. VKM B-3414]MDT7849511.1 tetraacyldisaccharide 4'-kinase [Methylophilus sp. VKM B-3414]